MTWPITPADVSAATGIAPRGVDGPALDLATAAAVAYVDKHVPAPAGGYGPDVELGACLLAARWFARRSSPGGVAAFADFGPAYIMRADPDVARLLGLSRPVVG